MMRYIVVLLGMLLTQPALAQFVGFPPGTFQGGAASAPAPGGCSQATTFIARTGYTGADATNLTTLICAGVTHGWITGDLSTTGCGIFDFFHVMMVSTNGVTGPLLNICGTSYTLSATGAPTFHSNQGFSGTSTDYFSTQFNPATATSPNWSQNSASIGFWSCTASISTNDAAIGTDFFGASGEVALAPVVGGGLFFARINSNTTGSNTNSVSKGLFAGDRVGATTIRTWVNGAQIGTDLTDTSQSPANFPITVIFVNSSVAAWPATFGMDFGGSSLGNTLQASFYTDMQAYVTAVGGGC